MTDMLKKNQHFIEEIPKNLELLHELLKKSKNYKNIDVKYDLKSFEQIERFFTDLGSGKEKSNFSRHRLISILATYVGEAIIHHGGGQWQLNDFEGDVNYGCPLVYGCTNDTGIGMAVFRGATRVFDEQKTGILIRSLKYVIGK